MRDIIYYYYNLKIDKISNKNNNYYFYYGGYIYGLLLYDNDIKILNNIYNLSQYIGHYKMHNIIKNNKNSIITMIDNRAYILIKFNNYKKYDINIQDIDFMGKIRFNLDKELIRERWNVLWERKIDYLEYQIKQIGLKYPELVDSFSYFVGMAENAISYYKNTLIDYKDNVNNNSYVIAHDKITVSTDYFYNPVNFIIDHKSRDLGEYIKLSFYNKNYNIFKELDSYFRKNYYTEYDMRLLIARIMYPSSYFNIYDNIIKGELKEKNISYVVDNICEYEKYLGDIFKYLENYYKIPSIEWLKK